MRVAFFGGTFDPVHRGHIAIARVAAEEFDLDEVIFAPVGRQPLKATAPLAPYADRLAMVRIACEEAGGESLKQSAEKLTVSEIDAPKTNGEPNYTVDTLRELLRSRPDAELYAIAGADSFLTLRSWREPAALLDLARWIVVSRPGFVLGDLGATLDLSSEQRARLHVLRTLHEDVSASNLRRRLSEGDDCRDWLPEPVLEYIRVRGLYGATSD